MQIFGKGDDLMRTRTSILFMLAILAVCLMSGCEQESAGEALNGAKKKRLRVVSIVKPQMRDLPQTTTQLATVHALQRAEIHAKVSGYLKNLHVDIGQAVAENDLLAVISVPEMSRAKESQDAEIERLTAIEGRHEAEKELADAQKIAADAQKVQAKSLIDKAVAHLDADLAERNRVRGLVKDMSVAKRLLDEAEKRYQSSVAAKSAAISGETSAQAQVVVAEKKVIVAQKEWDAAKHATTVARKKLAEMIELMRYATLTAPFDGVITERNVDKGDLIRNLQTAAVEPRQPLFVVADISQVRVHVAVPENAAPLVKVGATVVLTLRSLPGRRIECEVTRTSRTLDERTRTMLVEIVVPNPNEELLPGMYGEATIILKQKPKALVLPAVAVRFDKTGNATVYVLGKDDTVRIVSVKTGIDRGDEIEITEGLTVDDRVVGPMIGRLQAGQKVRVISK